MSPEPKNSTQPRVSVCIPTYNRRELLAETLESLRRQDYGDYEVIVCDDCSTDGTYEFLCSLKWPRLRVLRNERNLNLPGTMTRLFAEAKGEYIGMQHDHDLYEPSFLTRMVETMDLHPGAGFGCCAYHILDPGGRLVREPHIAEFNLFPATGLLPGSKLIEILTTRVSTPIPAMGTMFRRADVEEAGGYRPDWYLAADEDLYRRVAAISDVAFCREQLFAMRSRPAERHHVLGGWKGIYTLHEFRTDTARRFLRRGSWGRRVNVLRLVLLHYKSLWRESVVLWLRGDRARLKDALNTEAIPTLPTRRRLLTPTERCVLRAWLSLLAASRTLGHAIGNQRAKTRRTNVAG